MLHAEPGTVSGACFDGAHSPWPRPFSPPTPQQIALPCSPASQLLWPRPTSHARASSATAPRLPDADRRTRERTLNRRQVSLCRTTILDVPAQSLRAREAEWELATFATDKYRSSLTTSRKSLRCMRSYGCVRVSHPLRPCDRVGHAATFPVFGGWFESMKMGVFLLFGRTKRLDLHRNSPPAFFAAFRWQLGARCSLDRCDNSRAAARREAGEQSGAILDSVKRAIPRRKQGLSTRPSVVGGMDRLGERNTGRVQDCLD